MSGVAPPPDQAERERALDPAESFIVQAPAGSGKTELLIQRFLRLLACVEQPEEVLAVTFTLKAAGEMRTRVTEALRQAESGVPPAAAHLRQGYELARAVLQDDSRRAWQLHRHPSRLRISTIDSVNAWLAGRAPLGTGGSALMRPTDTPERLYQDAARATIALLAEDDEYARPVAALLEHLDNDSARLERLLVAMLPRREQWLRHVLGTRGGREAAEEPLREVAAHAIGRVAALIGPERGAEVAALLAFAAAVPAKPGAPANCPGWADRVALPDAGPAQLPAWQALAAALLTAKGEWRKSVDARQGFPPGTPEKKRMLELLAGCAGEEALREALIEVADLPGIAYADGQWELLCELVDVLRLAAAELRLAFTTHGEVDFPQLAAAALEALGPEDGPTELALALDHRVRHLLVDEFQDTSMAQFELLLRLTAGWNPGDGRTVFLVGDPMQSIYRFRQAEVSLFMRVRVEGIGQLQPRFLQLRANFRSAPPVVAWVNATFGGVFPPEDDAVMGAVRYAPSEPGRGGEVAGDVTLHWLAADGGAGEARRVAAIVAEAQATRPGETVCVLVRSRAHAGLILDALRGADVDFVAPEIENLERAGVAQDLLALTRALTQPADRLAWIGVLRAPFCGLTLADLHHLLATEPRRPVPEILRDEALHDGLSAPGRAAVGRLRAVLDRVDRARGRVRLRDLVEGAWMELGGPATLAEAAQRETAATMLGLIEAADEGGDCRDALWLGEQLARRHGSLGGGDAQVHVMTMHKAKGLEFDTVILPGLGRRTRGNSAPLLSWQEVPLGGGRSAPIVAPMGRSGEEGDPLHRWLERLDRRKALLESERLLYVACTRARRHLHLLAELLTEQDDAGATRARGPHAGSLLEPLWPLVDGEAQVAAAGMSPGPPGRREPLWLQPQLRRLPENWSAPVLPASLTSGEPAVAPGSTAVVFEWAGNVAMQVGSVVHRWLEVIARRGAENYDAASLDALAPQFVRALAELGTPAEEREAAARRVQAAIAATLADERGRWILSGAHAEAGSETALTVAADGRFRQLVVDRTFVDAEGTRWVVDYKTSSHQGADVDAFLGAEVERYREQLRGYRDAFLAMEARPVRVALWFPLLRAFREVPFGA